MKIAVTTQGDQIFQHFGQCGTFSVYTVDGKQIGEKIVLDASENGHEALGAFLKSAGVDVVICGGIGGGARQMLERAGIELISGIVGSVDESVALYIKGELMDKDGSCSHHEHDEEGHNCEHHCH